MLNISILFLSQIMSVSASLPDYHDKWTFYNTGYVFEIERISFIHFRKFRLEDHLYKARLRILDTDKAPPKLFEVLADMRSGIEQLIRNLQDIYKTNCPDAHLYLLFEDENSLAFTGVTTGTYYLRLINS